MDFHSLFNPRILFGLSRCSPVMLPLSLHRLKSGCRCQSGKDLRRFPRHCFLFLSDKSLQPLWFRALPFPELSRAAPLDTSWGGAGYYWRTCSSCFCQQELTAQLAEFLKKIKSSKFWKWVTTGSIGFRCAACTTHTKFQWDKINAAWSWFCSEFSVTLWQTQSHYFCWHPCTCVSWCKHPGCASAFSEQSEWMVLELK